MKLNFFMLLFLEIEILFLLTHVVFLKRKEIKFKQHDIYLSFFSPFFTNLV